MNSKSNWLLLSLVVCFLLLGCEPPKPPNAANSIAEGVTASGKTTTVNVDVTSFKKIRLIAPCFVTVTVGDTDSVTVTADESMQKIVTISTWSGDTLDIGVAPSYQFAPKKEFIPQAEAIKINITTKQLEEFELMGVGAITINNLQGQNFIFKNYGAANVKLTGQVEKLDLNYSGFGDFDSSGLNAKNVTINYHPGEAAKIKIKATESLGGKIGASAPYIKGKGSITYYGNPAKVSLASAEQVTVAPGQ